MRTPLLGWIRPQDRTAAQHDAHARAESKMQRFTLGPPPTGAVKLLLSDFWKDSRVIKDCGIALDRTPFRQLTGSCVGAGGGNAIFSLLAVQRCLTTGATRAILPFWAFSYGRCRYREGDRGPGEGAMGSAFAEQVKEEGVLPDTVAGLPTFDRSDGLSLTSREEMAWSDGNASLVTAHMSEAKVYPVQGVARVRSPQEIKALILNGFPGPFACDNYIGNASLKGTGSNERVIGEWNGRGGHQQFFFAYEDHPDFGPLYGIGNNWDRNTYPADPGGLPMCSCWVTESKVESALRLSAEVYGFSHASWFPAQPDVLDWAQMI